MSWISVILGLAAANLPMGTGRLPGESIHVSDPPGTIDLGVTTFGTPVSRTVTLKNYGTADGTVTGCSCYGLQALRFSINGPFPFTLTPGAIQTVQVTFDASVAGDVQVDFLIATAYSGSYYTDTVVHVRADVVSTSSGSSSNSCGTTGLEILPVFLLLVTRRFRAHGNLVSARARRDLLV